MLHRKCSLYSELASPVSLPVHNSQERIAIQSSQARHYRSLVVPSWLSNAANTRIASVIFHQALSALASFGWEQMLRAKGVGLVAKMLILSRYRQVHGGVYRATSVRDMPCYWSERTCSRAQHTARKSVIAWGAWQQKECDVCMKNALDLGVRATPILLVDFPPGVVEKACAHPSLADITHPRVSRHRNTKGMLHGQLDLCGFVG